MDDIERRRSAERQYEAHLNRSQTVWDRWSSWYGLSERDFESIRLALIDDLDLEPGDAVLEVGCGPGVNFEPIVERVGQAGRLTAVDYSPEMVEQARSRVEQHGWPNVTVVRADATTADFGGPYDAAIATLALSVMPDLDRTVANVHAALVSGGRLGVLDVRPAPSGPLRLANPLIRRFLSWYANWNGREDLLDVLDDEFDTVDQTGTKLFGTAVTAIAADTP